MKLTLIATLLIFSSGLGLAQGLEIDIIRLPTTKLPGEVSIRPPFDGSWEYSDETGQIWTENSYLTFTSMETKEHCFQAREVCCELVYTGCVATTGCVIPEDIVQISFGLCYA